ncbi:hypothetical protein BpOF4_06035 [Alkalihalophilus pseudofirmus OF4]|uniref:Uncharacterized protein n=1 Tax=Alkalihalophilus pseudofirmus (strain ATCC BAA-2126 / JCM 17055 / OF4) TaxID=398511 RepID=D3FZM7_ALKPO|nr:hypothetical protein [Alkalihalophilus pseudofirmus]ADC49269.1 hypothetical protein BpOF4_06035 [Alkalihalophilus pseudofirmus OF4]
MKNRIAEIEAQKNEKGLLKIYRDNNGHLMLEDRPKKKSSGLYWILTSYTMEELCQAQASTHIGAVNIPLLSKNRRDLHHMIKPTDADEFWIVYNGIGGCPKESKGSYDLGSRVIQEFSNHQKTGSLKILGTNLNDLSKWRYTYVELDWEDYHANKQDYETGWRLEYRWPILSKQ